MDAGRGKRATVTVDDASRPQVMQLFLQGLRQGKRRVLIVQGTPSLFFQAHDPGSNEEAAFRSKLEQTIEECSAGRRPGFLLRIAFSVYDRHFKDALRAEPSLAHTKDAVTSRLATQGGIVFSLPPGHFVPFTLLVSDDVTHLWLTESKRPVTKIVQFTFNSHEISDRIFAKYERYREDFDAHAALAEVLKVDL